MKLIEEAEVLVPVENNTVKCQIQLLPEFEEDTRTFTQYIVDKNSYTPCFSTINVLPPGLYDCDADPTKTFLTKRNNVTDDLVVSPDSQAFDIINELNKFWNKKEIFKDLGLVHKRGMLLYGPPGSGKTSIVSLLIKNIIEKGGVAILGDVHPITVTECLTFAREIEPEKPILLILEDIDSIIKNYGESQVLSLLDGENSINGMTVIATTNYPEDLAGRITNRPSRFDRVIEIGLPSYQSRLDYIKSRKLNLSDSKIKEWAKDTEGLGIAHIKELIVAVIALENPYEETLQRLHKMEFSPTSEPSRKLGFGD